MDINIYDKITGMKTKHLAFCALAVVATACTTKQTTCETPNAGGLVLENLDTTVLPQNDFYQYACGGWMKLNPLTPEYARFGSFDKLAENNRTQLRGLIEGIAAQQHEQGTIEQKIGDLYNLAMDSVRRNKEGVEPLKPYWAKIDAVTDVKELSALLPELYMDGMGGMFIVYVDADAMNSNMNLVQTYQSGYGLGEKEYYIDTTSACK